MRHPLRIALVVAAALIGCAPQHDEPQQEGPLPAEVHANSLACTLRGPTTIKVGESPALLIDVTNRTQFPMNLVYCLYGSNSKARYPHCYFKVTGPKPKSEPMPTEWCGVLDTLRPENFARVAPGGSFNPYGGPAQGQELLPGQFVSGGEYHLRFVYSTDGADLDLWLGAAYPGIRIDRPELQRLLDRVPRTTVESNEITLRVE